MLDYAGNKVEIKGCLGCAYANHEFSLPAGMTYEDDQFTLSQDWELPIQGFFVIAPKRHIEDFPELTELERNKMFTIINESINILKENKVCDKFNVIFEEKAGRHFHVWIMPRHKWMKELFGDITDNIGQIFDYAKSHLRTSENLRKIEEISNILKTTLNHIKF